MTEAEWLMVRQRKYDELSKLERVTPYYGGDPLYELHKQIAAEIDRLPWEQGGKAGERNMTIRHMVGPESSDGWVSWSDYLSLQAALREALEAWKFSLEHFMNADMQVEAHRHIEELRKLVDI